MNSVKKFVASLVLILTIISASVIFTGCSDKAVYSYESGEAYTAGGFTVEGNELKAVDIDWVSGSVTIEVDESLTKAEVSETSRYKIMDSEELRYTLEDGILTIKFRESSDKKVNLAKEKDLTIKVPSEKFIKTSVTVNSVSAPVYVNRIEPGKINVTNISGKTTIINAMAVSSTIVSTSGQVVIKNSRLYDLNVNTTSANIEVEDLTNDTLKLKSVSGEMNVDFEVAPMTLKAESTSGDINFTAPTSKGFVLTFDTVSGKFSTNFVTTMRDGAYVYMDNSSNFYTIETVSANVSFKTK